MNWLDWTLVAIFLVFIVGSARRGFSREIISLAACIIALACGMWFYGTAGVYIHHAVDSERTANLLGFLAVVFGVLLLGRISGWAVNRFLRTVGLSFLDRLLGAAFGLLKGLLVSVALLTAFMAFGPILDTTAGAGSGTSRDSVLHSRIAPFVLEASRLAVAAAPMELKSSFQRQYESIKSGLSQESNEGKF